MQLGVDHYSNSVSNLFAFKKNQLCKLLVRNLFHVPLEVLPNCSICAFFELSVKQFCS